MNLWQWMWSTDHHGLENPMASSVPVKFAEDGLLNQNTMGNPTEAVAEQPQNEVKGNYKEDKDTVELEENTDQEASVKDDKCSDSDVNSDDTNTNDEQIDVNINSNSQFYESSDSKIDYAVKIDDNDTLSDVEDIKTDSASADSEDSALGSLPPDGLLTDREEEVQDRCDGSDSGIGSETTEESKLPNFALDMPCSSGLNKPESSNKSEQNSHVIDTSNDDPKTYINTISASQNNQLRRSSLKRKREEALTEEPQNKKKKEGIRFDNVTVYYFQRAQGFSCVPSQGGSTLGMEWEHTHVDNFTLAEHALEQRRLHKQILQQLKNERHSLQGATFSSSEDSDTEEEASDVSESELDLDSYYFLQPIPTRQRRALLRAAGVRKIEGYEKNECRDIRTSREFCGCACKGVCNPVTCSCSLAGIKCQVDRLNFPCGCTRDGCSNTTGRIEFNPVRVRTHFIHTLMRIGLEKKNEEEAAKRQWANTRAANSSCMSNTTYRPEEGLLRDVSLSPRVEVESCVNAGSFSNVHCDMNNVVQTNHTRNIQENIHYMYRENALNHRGDTTSMMHMTDVNNHSVHADPYSSSILQGKGPPYPMSNNMGFNSMPHNIQRFSCDLNYSYNQHTESHHFKNLHSFSASSFEEFAHSSHMTMFSHYGHMYVPDYLHKQSTSMHEHNSVQYHQMTQNHYEMYKNTSEISAENKGTQQQYTNLMSLPYHANNKLQIAENDENWFSHNTLLNLDHTDQATQDATDAPSQLQPVVESTVENTPEGTENFGELIKKTMVESVSV